MNKSKNKGTAAETAVLRHLTDSGFTARRIALKGSQDQGDIEIFGLPVIVEVKNCATSKLSEWVDESQKEKVNAGVPIGVVWHKRKGKGQPKDWYVTMTGSEFTELLLALQKAHQKGVILDL